MVKSILAHYGFWELRVANGPMMYFYDSYGNLLSHLLDIPILSPVNLLYQIASII